MSPKYMPLNTMINKEKQVCSRCGADTSTGTFQGLSICHQAPIINNMMFVPPKPKKQNEKTH
jgi:hypothetical protein